MANEIEALVAEVIRSRGDAKYRTMVRSGLSKATEHHAYPVVYPHISNPLDRTGALRAAGLVASLHKVDHSVGITLGTSLFNLAVKNGEAPGEDYQKLGRTGKRLNQMVNQDMDGAAETLHRLLVRASDAHVDVNFHALARTIFYWNAPNLLKRQHDRSRTLREFYSNTAPTSGTI